MKKLSLIKPSIIMALALCMAMATASFSGCKKIQEWVLSTQMDPDKDIGGADKLRNLQIPEVVGKMYGGAKTGQELMDNLVMNSQGPAIRDFNNAFMMNPHQAKLDMYMMSVMAAKTVDERSKLIKEKALPVFEQFIKYWKDNKGKLIADLQPGVQECIAAREKDKDALRSYGYGLTSANAAQKTEEYNRAHIQYDKEYVNAFNTKIKPVIERLQKEEGGGRMSTPK